MLAADNRQAIINAQQVLEQQEQQEQHDSAPLVPRTTSATEGATHGANNTTVGSNATQNAPPHLLEQAQKPPAPLRPSGPWSPRTAYATRQGTDNSALQEFRRRYNSLQQEDNKEHANFAKAQAKAQHIATCKKHVAVEASKIATAPSASSHDTEAQNTTKAR